MKIGVLTYHCVPNFGAQLQCVSTIGYLKFLGHDPVVIHWYPRDLEEKYCSEISKEQAQIHMQFAEECMPLSKLCRTEKDVLSEIKRLQIEGIFAGSDALFKYIPESRRRIFSKRRLRFVQTKVQMVEDLDENVFFGAFIDKLAHRVKAVAFSISSQNCPYMELNMRELVTMKSSMEHYAKITARDEWTKEMVEYITERKNVCITPDPVFAFNQNCFLSIPSRDEILTKYSLPPKYVLISFKRNIINKRFVREIAKILEAKGLTPVAFPMPDCLRDYDLDCRIDLPLKPLDWYALIKYSQGYIGERMHPIVVCIHNAIPFFSFDEYGTFKKSLWGLRKKYIPSSSKIFHIVEKSGFINWRYAYFDKKMKLPKPNEIVEKIENFPKQKCYDFAKGYLDAYNQSMSKILKGLE